MKTSTAKKPSKATLQAIEFALPLHWSLWQGEFELSAQTAQYENGRRLYKRLVRVWGLENVIRISEMIATAGGQVNMRQIDELGPYVWDYGWVPELGDCMARMHLDRKTAAALIPLLQRFVETGGLHEDPPVSKQKRHRR